MAYKLEEVVQGYQGGQEAEVGLGLRRGDGPRRPVEVVADGLCDPTEWDALVADGVQPGAGRGDSAASRVQACGEPVVGPAHAPWPGWNAYRNRHAFAA